MYKNSVQRGILIKPIRCALCSRWVDIPAEGTEENIGVLCPTHKNEPASMKEKIKDIERTRDNMKVAFEFEKYLRKETITNLQKWQKLIMNQLIKEID